MSGYPPMKRRRRRTCESLLLLLLLLLTPRMLLLLLLLLFSWRPPMALLLTHRTPLRTQAPGARPVLQEVLCQLHQRVGSTVRGWPPPSHDGGLLAQRSPRIGCLNQRRWWHRKRGT